MLFSSFKEINSLFSKGMSNIYLKLILRKTDATIVVKLFILDIYGDAGDASVLRIIWVKFRSI